MEKKWTHLSSIVDRVIGPRRYREASKKYMHEMWKESFNELPRRVLGKAVRGGATVEPGPRSLG